ncbi:hypothetical protein GCM10007907_23060 [Chitinimonas prasina]|uniref:Uncharacterized protein n=1 Tax=Chitinimonas prasina TaxID=1434937 RepID=A0ABQ5YJQ3_9NEIS|nr:hypothetical protein [Chitinimonas prasina]GLR13516.1 hypothetical protein GCM10007907_23060 [Chitinimonas prasina]
MQPEKYLQAVSTLMKRPLSMQDETVVLFLGGSDFSIQDCAQVLDGLVRERQHAMVSSLMGRPLTTDEADLAWQLSEQGLQPEAICARLQAAVHRPSNLFKRLQHKLRRRF